MALIWDFYRTIGQADATGAVVHYYDGESQSFYLSGGIATRLARVEEGHWEDSVLSGELEMTDDMYNVLALDHPSNGVLQGAAILGNELYYLRYTYAMDISNLVETGTWMAQVDNAVTQLSVCLINIKNYLFTAENTLFNPGAKLTLKFRLGDSDAYSICVAYLDEIIFDQTADTVSISGRNAVGYFLKDQTFDFDNEYSGYPKAVIESILQLAGMERFSVMQGGSVSPFVFDSGTSLLDGINQILECCAWKIVEAPDGEVVIGDDSFIATWLPTGYYTFHGDHEVFARKTSKSADAAFTNVLVSGDDGITPVRITVNNFSFWRLGGHKTAHISAPSGMSAGELSAYAASIATQLQYVGMGESFTSPLRPQLVIGDVAEVFYDNESEATSLGLITEIKHTFGSKGFQTGFNIDSGGVVNSGGSYTIVSRKNALGGYNRSQRMTDFVRNEATNITRSNVRSMTSMTVTLPAADWSDGHQTVSLPKVTASNTVIVSPLPASQYEYGACGVLCSAQGAGTLTFTCTVTPANNLTIGVVIL